MYLLEKNTCVRYVSFRHKLHIVVTPMTYFQDRQNAVDHGFAIDASTLCIKQGVFKQKHIMY